jgi:small subunit ribosomal protein S21
MRVRRGVPLLVIPASRPARANRRALVYDEGKADRPGRFVFPKTESEVNRLAEVVVQDGETVESALRRFKRKVQQEDIIKEIKRHSYYLKPGEKKRAKQALARKRNRKRQAKMIE